MISKFWSKWVLHFGLVSFLTVTEGLYNPQPIVAQVIPDNTLGAENSLLIKLNELNERIDGGAMRGSNLFHSFLEFNVGESRGVYFANPAGIENILSRVTGGNPSNILGRLGVLGGANLFLLNPHGILFGPNASLDIKGSFVAATANGIQLGEKGFFSATEPEKSNLLSVNPGSLFFNQVATHSGNIINRGNLAVGKNLTISANNLDLQGQLYAGGNLTLQALGTVQIRDSVASPFVAAAKGNLLVQGNETVDIFTLNHPQSGLFSGRNMVLSSANTVGGDAHYWSGGNFRIEQLDGSLGGLYSPYDPIIRSLGDVSFQSYTGASLHILARGSVTIGSVTITSAEIGDVDDDFLQETITLSDGTPIDINGSEKPTLDIRAGVLEQAIGTPKITGVSSTDIFIPTPPTSTETPSSADIKIETISFETPSPASPLNVAGQVLLTNQYHSNDKNGNIEIARLPNSTVRPFIKIESYGDGGSIVIDSKGSINLNGNLQASAKLNLTNPMTTLGNGGNVTLLAQDNITLSIVSEIESNGMLGGAITLNAKKGSITLNSFSGIESIGEMKGGAITLTAQDNINLNPNFRIESKGEFGGAITLNSEAITGARGTIAIESSLRDSETPGGAIKITADSLSLNGTTISTTEGSNFGISSSKPLLEKITKEETLTST